MALNLQDKKAIIAKVIEVTKDAHSAVIADSRGITVNKITKLRKAGRECGVYMRVIRNTLMRRIVEGTPFQCLQDNFLGPTLVAFSMEHPGAAARLFKDFAKLNKNFKVNAAAFQGNFIPASQIDFLATMPTYKEAILSFMLVMKDAIAGKLVRTLVACCEKRKVS